MNCLLLNHQYDFRWKSFSVTTTAPVWPGPTRAVLSPA